MLFPSLQPFFAENSFPAAAKSGIFRKVHPDGWQTVTVLENPQPAGVLVELQLGIRHTLVEEIVYPFELGLRTDPGEAQTLQVTQSQIEGAGPGPEWIHDEADAILTARRWQQWMLEKGFAWLDIYRQVAWLNQLYNDDLERARRWQPEAFSRTLRAVALAYLGQRVDFRNVVKRGKRELAEVGAAPEMVLRLDGLVGALP